MASVSTGEPPAAAAAAAVAIPAAATPAIDCYPKRVKTAP